MSSRNERIINRVIDEPTVSWRALSKEFGISHEMCRRIVTRYMRGLDINWQKARVTATYTCKKCNKLFDRTTSVTYCANHSGVGLVNGNESRPVRRVCMVCGAGFSIGRGQLARAARARRRVGVYCSNACRHVGRRIKKIPENCSICGNEFTRIGRKLIPATCSLSCGQRLRWRKTARSQRPLLKR